MTDQLESAIAQATTQIADLLKHAETLSPAEQNELATRLEALANDLRWEQLLDDPSRAAAVDALADQALADFAAGNSRPLDCVFEQRAQQHLQHPEVAAGYGEMETELQLVRALDALRQQQHLTQDELARRMGRQRASLSRLFSADHPNPRLDTLSDLLVALGVTAEVHLRHAREGEPPIQVDVAAPV